MIGLHIQHSKGMIFMRNYMYYHVSILKRLLGFGFKGLKRGFKKDFSTFGQNAGYKAIEFNKEENYPLNTHCVLSRDS